MPWKIVQKEGKHCVVKESDGAIVHCHETREEAEAQMKALYANENKSEEQLAYYGGAVKALGGGKIAGYGVLFTTASDPDLEQEVFTKNTDLELEIGDRRSIYYRHGAHPVIKNRKLGKAVLTNVDDAGAFFEGELNLRDEYEKYIYRLAEMGKLGWSTGSAPHLVRREPKEFNGNRVAELKSWPIAEISLTPCPVEPRTAAFPIKELANIEVDEIKELMAKDEEPPILSLEGLPGLKALCEALSPAVTITRLEHSEIADAAVKELLTHSRVFVDAFRHYRARLNQHVEFRKERNRKPMSDSESFAIQEWTKALADVRKGIESIEG